MDDSQGRELTKGMHRSTGSYELVMAPLLLAFLGFFLDRWLGTTPLLILLLAVVGLVGASVNLYYGYKHEMEEHEANAAWRRPLRATETGDTNG
jgi:F0F1-type ATP synthase assembly protein I